MKKINSIVLFLVLVLLLNSCAKKQYVVKSVSGYLVEMNNSFDNHIDSEMLSLVEKYKAKLDAEMNEVIGEATLTLTKSGTQSVLATFTADAMQEYATGLWGETDFAVINNGGLRTWLNQGSVTVGNLYEIYAFENCLVLLDLPGKAVKELFDAFAQNKIEGFSKNIRLVLNNKAVESLTIGGKPIDTEATYRVVTVDYLAEGNDGMEALTQATECTNSYIILRDAMIEYIRNLTAKNEKIHATPDERIEIKE
jgi:2',3'-cyclic-nucleotide 2'-phosphodiesterase (5'-nucleotidase family)